MSNPFDLAKARPNKRSANDSELPLPSKSHKIQRILQTSDVHDNEFAKRMSKTDDNKQKRNRLSTKQQQQIIDSINKKNMEYSLECGVANGKTVNIWKPKSGKRKMNCLMCVKHPNIADKGMKKSNICKMARKCM